MLSLLTAPVTILVMASVFSAGVAMWLRPTPKWRRLAGLCLVMLWLAGLNPVADAVIRPLEAPYRSAYLKDNSLAQQTWIVVLAGGARWGSDVPPAAWLTPQSVQRVAEGVRLQKFMPKATLVLMGGYPADLPQAPVHPYAALAATMGADMARVMPLTGARNTQEEAQMMAKRVSAQTPHLVLVTSAVHMRRAQTLFAQQGLTAIPSISQAHTLVQQSPGWKVSDFVPTLNAYERLHGGVHEWLGLLYARLTPSL